MQRLLESGPQCLSEVELLDLLLRFDEKSGPHECVAQLLAHFGSLRALICAQPSMLKAAGLSTRRYVVLQAAVELARRHYHGLMTVGTVLGNPRATREYLRMRLRDIEHEVFAIVYLDNRNRVIVQPASF